ncbi:unnamed protein product [Parnassius apollo]|uniref:(apollo) hypothetical protein n=1 Tax=Parnassius apollo TaxID=110799 RepID=A0A8S3XQB5_PARAO|nr:unnamed protein product [Parnassius apollo]
MKDDLAFNIKFVELVHERPRLYEYTRPDYSNRNAQDASWLEIAKIVEESGPLTLPNYTFSERKPMNLIQTYDDNILKPSTSTDKKVARQNQSKVCS